MTQARRRRRRSFLGIVVALLAAAVLFLPTLASFSGVGRSLLASHFAKLGWSVTANDVRMGWITPVSASGMTLVGPSGQTEIQIDQFRGPQTLLAMFAGGPGQTSSDFQIHGLGLTCFVEPGTSSLERDLQTLQSDEESEFVGHIDVQSVDAKFIVDANTAWTFSGANGSVDVAGPTVRASLEGMLTDPDGHSGGWVIDVETDATGPRHAGLVADDVPLSVLELIDLRCGLSDDRLVDSHGGLTGEITVDLGDDPRVVARHAVVRNLQLDWWPQTSATAEQTPIRWTNQDARADGELRWRPDAILVTDCRLAADFASATGSAVIARGAMATDLPGFVRQFEGDLRGEIDLAAMNRTMPGLLPLRGDVELDSATAKIDLVADPHARHIVCQAHVSPINGHAAGRPFQIDPVSIATDIDRASAWKINELTMASSFGTIEGNGKIDAGQFRFDLQLDTLARTLDQLLVDRVSPPRGQTRGLVRWQRQGERWNLSGDATATGLVIPRLMATAALPLDVKTTIEASAIYDDRAGQIRQLDSAETKIVCRDAVVQIELAQPTPHPMTSPVPLRATVRGDASTLQSMAGVMLHADCRGPVEATINAVVDGSDVTIGDGSVRWTDAAVVTETRSLHQSELTLDYAGQIELPAQRYRIERATFVSPVATAVMTGTGDWQRGDLTCNVRTELSRIAELVGANNSPRSPLPPSTSPQSRSPTPPIAGDVTGDIEIAYGPQDVIVRPDLQLSELLVSNGDATQSIWFEPLMSLRGELRTDRLATLDPSGSAHRTFDIQPLILRGDWFQTELGGQIVSDARGVSVRCDGPSTIDMAVVADRVTPLVGTPIVAEGLTHAPVEIWVESDNELRFEATRDVGWDRALVAGVQMGSSRLPVKWTQSGVSVAGGMIPVGGGQLHVNAAAIYQPGPLRIHLEPGPLAERIELTPAMTATWMQYLAPVVAGAANVSGTFSATIDHATIVPSIPPQTVAGGRLQIEQATMTAGQMVDRLLIGVDQARRLTGSAPSANQSTGRTLVRMPPQMVEFSVRDGVVGHDRMYFGIDRAEVVTSGQVTTDGRINMMAQIPIDSSWVGRDLGALAGRPLTLPVSGTLSNIRVDTAAVGQLISDAVLDAGQQEVGQFLDKQIGRGLEKLLGR